MPVGIVPRHVDMEPLPLDVVLPQASGEPMQADRIPLSADREAMSVDNGLRQADIDRR